MVLTRLRDVCCDDAIVPGTCFVPFHGNSSTKQKFWVDRMSDAVTAAHNNTEGAVDEGCAVPAMVVSGGNCRAIPEGFSLSFRIA